MARPVSHLPTRQKVFDFICSFKELNDGNSPSLREIKDKTGITSTSVVTYYLDKLEIAGLIKRDGRIIKVVGASWVRPVAGN